MLAQRQSVVNIDFWSSSRQTNAESVHTQFIELKMKRPGPKATLQAVVTWTLEPRRENYFIYKAAYSLCTYWKVYTRRVATWTENCTVHLISIRPANNMPVAYGQVLIIIITIITMGSLEIIRDIQYICMWGLRGRTKWGRSCHSLKPLYDFLIYSKGFHNILRCRWWIRMDSRSADALPIMSKGWVMQKPGFAEARSST